MGTTKVFLTFDTSHEKQIRDFIERRVRLRGAAFEIVGHSLKKPTPGSLWEKTARIAISHSDFVLVIVGAHTHEDEGAVEEVRMALKAGVPIIQMAGYKDRTFPAVPEAGPLHGWSWEDLQTLLVKRKP